MNTESKSTKEIWKAVKDYEGLYEVSNLGRVKSLSRTVVVPQGPRITKERILRFNDVRGYKRVTLCINKANKQFSVHRLVAEAFIPNPENKPCVNHINEVPGDDRVENLEWVTHKENTNHGTGIERSASKRRTKVYQYTKAGEFVKKWKSFAECAEAGFNHGNIVAVCQGKRKSHKGFYWSYTKLKSKEVPQRERVKVYHRITCIGENVFRLQYGYKIAGKSMGKSVDFSGPVPSNRKLKTFLRKMHDIKQVELLPTKEYMNPLMQAMVS